MNIIKYFTKLKKPKGFTLIELIIVIAFFGLISAMLMTSLLSIYRFNEVLKAKKELNFEASSIFNNGLPSLIRSGFAINYDLTHANESKGISKGFKDKVDQISIFTNQAESEYFTIYRKPYHAQGEESDTAGIWLKFMNGEEVPLHSSELVVEDFDIQIPVDPRLSENSTIQPYVRLYIRFRHRYPFREIVDENQLSSHQTIRASYSTTITLRNTGPASYKNFPVAFSIFQSENKD